MTSPTIPPHLETNPLVSQWIAVNPDGEVSVFIGKVELGQGIVTAIAQVAAEELDVDIARVQMIPASTEHGPAQGLTAGSLSVIHTAPAVRIAAAHARHLLLEAAAGKWGVDPATVTVSDGVMSGPGGQRAGYGELASVVDLAVRADAGIATKPATRPGAFVGHDVPRIDLPDKVSGRPRFIHDLRLPGQLFGRVVRPPSPGATLTEVDETRAAALGATVVRDGSFLGVLAEDESVATRAAELLRREARWDETQTLPDEDAVGSFLRAGPHEDVEVASEGTVDAEPVLRATYSRPFLAHASIAPSCGVARWDESGRVTVWSHSQGITGLRDAIAQALDLDAERVEVEHAEGAGSYGHNGADDAAYDAVLLARAVPGRSVHLQWRRQDELTWGPLGSAMSVDLAASTNDDGDVAQWSADIYSQGHTARPGYAGVPGLLAGLHQEPARTYPAPVDPPAKAGFGSGRNGNPGYVFPARRVVAHRLTETPIRTSSIRALGAHLNVFAIESFLDELAELAGVDPVEYRLRQLDDPRARAVVERAAEEAAWGQDLPDGSALGIGYARYKAVGAYCAVVARVDAEQDIAVPQLTIAADVGRVINPDGVRNQLEGGAIQSASWTLRERVRFDRTRFTSDDWETYPILRFSDAPHVDVHLVDDGTHPSVGSGEASQGPTAAAIGNAVARAIGVRVRDLPITQEAVVRAIEES
jgi:CO/xanthine dehydrogenase Mo-binding subunit